MTQTLTFFDDRFGDRYIITTDTVGDFSHAIRYLDRNPCGQGHEYDRVEDLPPGVRYAIEQFLRKHKS